MIIGVCCVKCGNPVDNRGTEEEPKYYCITCDEFVDDIKGIKDQTIWNAAKDTGKKIELNRAERRVLVSAFSALDKAEKVTPIQAELWRKFREAYPEKQDETKGEEIAEENDKDTE